MAILYRSKIKCIYGNFEKQDRNVAEEADEEEGEEDQGAEGEISTLVAIAGYNSKLQSQLTTVERYLVNADFMTNLYRDELSEAQALQAMNLSAAISTATLPILVGPTHASFMTEANVFVDMLRMQAGLGLTDADRARSECPKCNKDVDQLRYHAAFCPTSTILVATSMMTVVN